MIRHSLLLRGRSGFYVALHPWLQVAGVTKVGYSRGLETRLHMPSFATCFTDEWVYHTVFECTSPKEALLLEQAVLFCLADKRIPHRELLKAPGEDIVRVARVLAKKLGLAVVERSRPTYEMPERCNHTEPASSLPTLVADLENAHSKAIRADNVTEASCQRPHETITPHMAALQSVRAALRKAQTRTNDDNFYAEEEQSGDSIGSCLEVEEQHGQQRLSWAAGCLPNKEGGGVGDITNGRAVGSAYRSGSGTQPLPRLTDMAMASLIDSENYTLECLRPYQREAVLRVTKELGRSGRAICQMACRCGKTPVAFAVMKDTLLPVNPRKSATGRVLYLVPGLSLLRQTAQKLFNYGLQRVPMLLVGSDPHPVLLGPDVSETRTMTTNPEVIRAFLLQHAHSIIVCTYHSSPLLECLTDRFALTVFDECHRVCGSTEKTTFNAILLRPSSKANKRLFLTATPTYDTPIRMSNEALFGGIAYRYYLREGIDSGFVNPFRVRVVLGPSLENMVPFLMEAMRHVDKMLIFCRNIQHAELLYRQLSAALSSGGHELDDVKPFASFIAHSRMSSAHVAATLLDFSSCRRCVLFNVRLFQEGVEIADLNAVFFAAPRYSSRDIIQSICRPLNRLPNKPTSYVFLPAAMNTRYRADHPINLQNFSTLVPFTDALMDEDPTLFEYMLDPQKRHYDVDVVGLRSLKLSSEKLHKFVLPAVRRGVRYSCTTQSDRLMRAARLPWKHVFAEMKRIVLECNRYPKTNDAWVVGDTSVSMNLFYRYCRKGYLLYQAGTQTYLQTYQIRDLESLPEWRRYGVEGPYPWKECLETLERHLVTHRSPPPLDVHKGGFIGLDATPFERLSGCLMHVNQCDAKQDMRLAPEKQRDMEELCGRFGLKWRKTRNSDGTLRKNERTFITDSYNRFKRLFRRIDRNPVFKAYVEKHYPGYPEKHARMENLDVLMGGKVPPRQDPLKRRGRRGATRSAPSTATMKERVRRGTKTRGRTAKKRSLAEASPERSVMCRICRAKVTAATWAQHVVSPQHVAAVRNGHRELHRAGQVRGSSATDASL